MKAKYIISCIAAAMIATATAGAKTVDQLRIYINPGHGSWTSDDRPNQVHREVNGALTTVIPHTAAKTSASPNDLDTTAFFETNTNLQKGFAMMEELIKYGFKFDRTKNQTNSNQWRRGAALDLSNNIVMSRVKSGPYPHPSGGSTVCNRDLSEIREEVEVNNFDMFVSIHSNAATEGTSTNYPLYLYRGYDNRTTTGAGLTTTYMNTCYNMASVSWPYAYENTHSVWSAYASSKNIRGDINFKGSSSTSKNNGTSYLGYYGVLKHGVPGFLVEGYFHTYQPARHRAMNWDVCHVEGLAYAKGVADYYGLTKTGKGWIYGIIRDRNTQFSADKYTPKAGTNDVYKPMNGCTVVLKKDGVTVQRKTTDNFYNGAYVFKDLDPGTYTVYYYHPTYGTQSESVTVTANNVNYLSHFFTTANSNTIPGDEGVTYPDLESCEFDRYYIDNQISQLAGKTIRRMVAHGNYLYILALDSNNEPTIIVYDPDAKFVAAEVSTTGMQYTTGAVGQKLRCSDIQVTSDGVLLACNKEKTQCDNEHVEGTEPRGTWRLYKWANDANGIPTGNPVQWVTTQNTGNWYRSYTGETFAYSGSSTSGKVVVSCETTGSSRNLRTQVLTISGGSKTADAYYQPVYDGSVDNFTVKTLLDGYKFVTSPVDNTKYYIVSSGNIPVLECNFEHAYRTEVLATLATSVLPATTNGVSGLTYGSSKLLVAPQITGGSITGVGLVNIDNDIANATAVNTENTDVSAASAASYYTAGRQMVDENNNAYIDLFLLRDNKLSYFTTYVEQEPEERPGVNPPEPHNTAALPYAYDLNAQLSGNFYNITFKSTEIAPKAYIVFYDEDNIETGRYQIGSAVKGENSYLLNRSDVSSGNHHWGIILEGFPNNTAAVRVVDTTPNLGNVGTRGGIAIVSDNDSPYYGYPVVTNGFNKGVWVYNPDLTLNAKYWENSSVFSSGNASSPFRLDTYQGKVYVSDWYDSSSGYYLLDLANPSSTPVNVLAGTANDKGGYIYNGNNIGGGATDFAFYNGVLWAFSEDFSSANTLVGYNISSAPTEANKIAKVPEHQLGRLKMDNTNVCIAPTSQGLFLGQVRGAGQQNSGVPGFVFVDYSGNILYNSGSENTELNSSCGAVAVSPDESLLAVTTVADGIVVYKINWNNLSRATAPFTLERQYVIAESVGRSTGNNDRWTDLEFDPAGNLLAYERGYGLQMFALPNESPSSLSMAKSANMISGQGLTDNVSIEADDAEPIYYNLQGVAVDGDNLAPGIYIKVTGKKSQKVVIK